MKKKANLRRGLDSVFSASAVSEKEPIERLAERTRTSLRIRKPTDDRPVKEKGCKPGETRATILIAKDLLEKLKNAAYWERLPIKEIISTALEAHVEKYEKKNGPIKQRKK